MADEDQTDFKEDFQINDNDIFKCILDHYMEVLQNHASKQNVTLEAYKLESEKGIEVKGTKKNVKDQMKYLKETIRSIKVENNKYEDLSYFLTSDGLEKMKDLEEKYSVKLRIENSEETCMNTMASNFDSDSPSYRWKFPQGQQLLLTYGRGMETGAEVVTQIFETDKPVWGRDLKTENQNGVLIVQLLVPSNPELKHKLKDSISKLLHQIPTDGYRTIAIEVDTCTSWTIDQFTKCLVTCFLECIQWDNSPRDLKLYMCVTQGNTKPDPLRTCNSVLDDWKQKFEFEQINKQLKEDKKLASIEICKGDITKIQADMIVNTVSPDLDLSVGTASRALLKAAGPSLQTELDARYRQGLDNGEVAITKGHKLPCRYILHGFLQMYDESKCSGYDSPLQFYEISVHEFLTSCLKKAAELHCKVVSIPVIGTGALMYPTNVVARQIYKTFDMFEPAQRPEKLKIVVYYRDEDVFEVFQEEKVKFEMEQRQDFQQRLKRRSSNLLKIVGSEASIKSVKAEILTLIKIHKDSPNQSHSDKPVFKFGQKLTFDGLTDTEVNTAGGFKPKRSSRSMSNLQKSRRGESSSVSSITPPASPSTYDSGESLVSCLSMSEKENGFETDAGRSDSNKSVLDRCNNGTGIGSSGPKQNLLKTTMLQSGVDSERDITYDHGAQDFESNELLKCSKTEFELLEFFQPEYIEKYKHIGCLIEYCNNPSRIMMFGEKPKTKSIKDIRLDLTNTLAKIRRLQSESVNTSSSDQQVVRKFIKESISKDVYIDDHQLPKNVTIYSESFDKVAETAHQLKINLGIVRKTNRQERQFKSTSTYLSQMQEQAKADSHSRFGDHKPSTPKDHITQTGAKPKTGRNSFSWSTNAKHLEMFAIDDKIEVRVYQGSILQAPVDCIVNAANSNLQHGGGVARVISQAAGRDLDREGYEYVRRYGNLQVGEVCVTCAGRLNYACVIHAVGPNWTDYRPFNKADVQRCERDLCSAIRKSLEMAERRGLKSIAFPGISAGIYACPWELCFVQYAKAVIEYSREHSKSKIVQEVHFVDTNEHLVKQVQYTFKTMITNEKLPKSYNIDSIVATAKRGYFGKGGERDHSSKDSRGRGGQRGSTSHSGGREVQSKYSRVSGGQQSSTSHGDPKGRGKQHNYTPQSDSNQGTTFSKSAKSDQFNANTPQSTRQEVDQCYPYVCRKPPPGLSLQEFVCVVSPKQQMFIYEGAITDNLVGIDMIACGEKVDGLGAGKVAQHIEKYLGQDYVKKKKYEFINAKEGNVIVVKTKRLQVAHVIMHQKKAGLDEKNRRLKNVGTYENLFTKAMKLKCKGIAIPLIGSGKGGVPIAGATERLCEGFRQFNYSNPNYEMTVHLVNSDKDKTKESIETIEKLVACLKESVQPDGSQNQNATSGTPSKNKKNGYSSDNPRKQSPQYQLQQKQNDSSSRSKNVKTHAFYMNAESELNQGMDVNWDSDEEHDESFRVHKDYNPRDYEEQEIEDECDLEGYEEQGPKMEAQANANEEEPEDCVICMEKLKQPKQLTCGHKFCSDCIEQQFVYKEACPVCGKVCGTITGDQPEGTMKVTVSKDRHCAGYEKFGRIEITYHFPDGKQGSDHPSPGKWYKGITRTAFLPDNKKGKQIQKMLKVAFDRKLVFTIGNSRTTGQEGVITWNDIHHKTDPKPNTQFGYPDPGYLDRVADELAAKGVTESDI